MTLYKFFKRESLLPKPDGPLSAIVPSRSISAANKEVEQLLDVELEVSVSVGKRRGWYNFFSPVEKAEFGKRAVEHGVTATIRYWK